MAAIARGQSFMRPWLVVLVLPLLAGCTDFDWNSLLGFGQSANRQSGDDARPTAVAPPARVATSAPAPVPVPAEPAPAQPNAFCLGIARQDATTNDFDPATQQKAAVQSYQQCVAIFGD
jgi:hypothetical protein